MGSPDSKKLDILVEFHCHLVEYLGKNGGEANSESIILDSFRASLSLYMADRRPGSCCEQLEELVTVQITRAPTTCVIESPRRELFHSAFQKLRRFRVFPMMHEKKTDPGLAETFVSQTDSDLSDLKAAEGQFKFLDFCPLTEEEKDDFTTSLAIRRKRAITGFVGEKRSREPNAA